MKSGDMIGSVGRVRVVRGRADERRPRSMRERAACWQTRGPKRTDAAERGPAAPVVGDPPEVQVRTALAFERRVNSHQAGAATSTTGSAGARDSSAPKTKLTATMSPKSSTKGRASSAPRPWKIQPRILNGRNTTQQTKVSSDANSPTTTRATSPRKPG